MTLSVSSRLPFAPLDDRAGQTGGVSGRDLRVRGPLAFGDLSALPVWGRVFLVDAEEGLRDELLRRGHEVVALSVAPGETPVASRLLERLAGLIDPLAPRELASLNGAAGLAEAHPAERANLWRRSVRPCLQRRLTHPEVAGDLAQAVHASRRPDADAVAGWLLARLDRAIDRFTLADAPALGWLLGAPAPLSEPASDERSAACHGACPSLADRVIDALAREPAHSVDGFVLGAAGDAMSAAAWRDVLRAIRRAARPGARIAASSLLPGATPATRVAARRDPQLIWGAVLQRTLASCHLQNGPG